MRRHHGLEHERRRPWRRWLPLLAILLLTAIVLHQGLHHGISLDAVAANEQLLRDLVAENWFTAVAGYALLYVVTIALSLPVGAVLTLAGGFLFGWMVAAPVTVVAATIGATLIFVIARTTLGEALAVRAGPRLAAISAGFRRDAWSYLLFLRLVPAFPFWLVNLAPALLGVSLSTFVGATLIGIVPGTFAIAVIGSGLEDVLAARREGTALLTPGLVAALVALGVLALVPVAARRLRGRRD